MSCNQGVEITKEKADHVLRRSRKGCVPTGSDLKDRFDYYVHARQKGTWPLTKAAWFSAYEPVQNVTAGHSPTMLLHGRADTTVPFSVPEHLSAALEAEGVTHEFVSRAGWNYAFDQVKDGRPGVKAALQQVLAFLDEHLR